MTVNLTSLLVLTTLFISVSGALPPTAYVKMIDIWLIFSQLIPFFEVLIHTFIDVYRNDGQREINHHGHSILVENDFHVKGSEKWTDKISNIDLAYVGEYSGKVK